MGEFRVLVCGSRTYEDREMVEQVLAQLEHAHGLLHVIHGGAKGADRLAARATRRLVTKGEVFLADWRKHGKAAGPIRNRLMLAEGRPDLVCAFVDKPLRESKGTCDMVTIARAAGVPVNVFFNRVLIDGPGLVVSGNGDGHG